MEAISTTKRDLTKQLAAIGYRIDERCSFNYRNNYNAEKYDARSVYLVEADTGIGFANIKARRDANFHKLQAMRGNNYLIKGRIYEL